MNLKTNKMNYEQLDKLAVLFMEQFPALEPLSLDEFLEKNARALYPEQYNLGTYIVSLYYEV